MISADKFSKAIVECSTMLLNQEPDAVDRSLDHIIKLSEASRIYIFQNFYDKELGLCIRQTNEKCAPGVEPEIDNPVLQKLSYLHDGFSRWKETLEKGEMIKGNTVDFPKDEQEILLPQDIKTILVIPLNVNNEWFGFIGFDYVAHERELTDWDSSLLKSASELISAYYASSLNHERIQKEIQLNDDKNQFIRVLSHDLKSPFSGILSMTKLLSDRAESFDIETIKKASKKLHDSTKNTFKLLEELLIWLEAHTNEVSFSPVKINLNQLIQDKIRVFYSAAHEKGIRLITDLCDVSFVLADEYMVKVVLRNLVNNAIKFTNAGGHITISTKATQDGFMCISIKDNGTGMDPELMKVIWGLSGKESRIGTAGEKGTGLGLKICKDYVERHDGEISVVNNEMGGCTFSFTIPLVNKEVAN